MDTDTYQIRLDHSLILVNVDRIDCIPQNFTSKDDSRKLEVIVNKKHETMNTRSAY